MFSSISIFSIEQKSKAQRINIVLLEKKQLKKMMQNLMKILETC